MMLPDADGLDAAAAVQGRQRATARGHRASRATAACRRRSRRCGPGPSASSRSRSSRRRCSAILEKAVERRELRAENEQLRRQLAGPVQAREHHRQEQADARPARAGRERRRQRRQHPDPGRERHGQGADRQRASTTNSKRASGPFIKINCAAIPKDLIESELFGYKKGAFTGASTDKDGPARGWPTAARCCSTRSARCRPTCRPSCCACCRSASTGPSAATASCTWTSG